MQWHQHGCCRPRIRRRVRRGLTETAHWDKASKNQFCSKFSKEFCNKKAKKLQMSLKLCRKEVKAACLKKFRSGTGRLVGRRGF